MRDIIEHLEAGAEANYYEMLQPDGRLKCRCGKIFDPNEEGAVISSNPYGMPICGDCFARWRKQITSQCTRRGKA